MLSYKEYDMRRRSRSSCPAACPPKSSTRSRASSRPSSSGTVRSACSKIKDFEGMDSGAFWHDVQFSLRYVQDFSRIVIVTNPDVHHLWSSLVAPLMRCDVEHFSPGELEAARD